MRCSVVFQAWYSALTFRSERLGWRSRLEARAAHCGLPVVGVRSGWIDQGIANLLEVVQGHWHRINECSGSAFGADDPSQACVGVGVDQFVV